jgi:hypothetical protein
VSGATGDTSFVGVNPGPAPPDVDLELVLAVDVSSSMSRDELRVQRQGYVAAMRHPDVVDAITSGPLGRVAIVYLEWAGPGDQAVTVPWTILSNGEDAIDFAAQLAATPMAPGFDSPPWESGTSISNAMLFAADLISANDLIGLKATIDISGDGPNNSGVAVEIARGTVVEAGITINGLPIVSGKRSIPVESYYKDCVVGGPGAFVIPVNDASSFATAIRNKLVLEIASSTPRAFSASAAAVPEGHARAGHFIQLAATSWSGSCNDWRGFDPGTVQYSD